MRPPEFTGGNKAFSTNEVSRQLGFNEAAGIHRRKLGRVEDVFDVHLDASMRPPEFTGGNDMVWFEIATMLPGFNEAAGIHRRKLADRRPPARPPGGGFNEAAGIHRRKHAVTTGDSLTTLPLQ